MLALINHKLLQTDIRTSSPCLGAAVIVLGGKVLAITAEDKLDMEWPGCKIIDLGGNFLSPGLIDLQVSSLFDRPQ